MVNKKSGAVRLTMKSIVLIIVAIGVALILLGLTGRLSELGQSIWKGLRSILPFV